MHELTTDKVISKNKVENFSDLVIKHKEVDAKINQEMYRDVLNKMNTNNLSLDEKQDLGMINNYRTDNNLKSNYDKFLKDKTHNTNKKQYKYILPKRSQTVPQEGFRSRTKRETLLADTDITPFAASKDKKISSLKKKMTIQNYIKEQILQETIFPNTEASEGLAFEQFRSTRTSLESKQQTTKKILPRSKQKLPPDSLLQTAQEKQPSKVMHLPTDKLFLADDYSEIRQQNTMIANEQLIAINEIIDKNNLMSQVVEVKVLVKNTLFIIPLNYQTNIFHFYNLVNDFKKALHNDNLEIKYETNNKQNLVIEVRNKYQIPLSFSRLITSFQKQPSHLLALLGMSKNNYAVFCLDFLEANSYLIWSEDVVQNEKIGNNIIFSLILKNNIQKVAFAIFDLNPSKENSLQYLNGFSYLVAPVCQEIIPAIAYLDKLIAEIRYRLYLIETFEAPDFASLQKALQPDDNISYLVVLLYKLEFLIATDPKNIFLKLNFILDNATKAGLIFIATVNKLSNEDPLKAFVTKINNVIVSESCATKLAFLSGAEISAPDLQNDEMVRVDLQHQQQTPFKVADLPFKVAQRTVDYVRLNLKTEYDSNFTNLFQSYKPKLLNLDKTFLRTEMYPLLKTNSHFNLEYLLTQLPNTNPNQIVRILHFLEMTGNLTIDQANEGYFDFAVT